MNTSKGYIALSMILLLTVVSLAIAMTVSFLSIGEGQSGLAHELGEGTMNLVEECTEDLIIRARNDAGIAILPSTTITEPEGTCTATRATNTWTITNTTGNYFRTIQVTFTRDGYGITFTPGTTASNWKEQ